MRGEGPPHPITVQLEGGGDHVRDLVDTGLLSYPHDVVAGRRLGNVSRENHQRRFTDGTQTQFTNPCAEAP
ncbi:MAG: hypothetical protein AUH27_02020 [Chloroflexi bacterium 13_1_40CM_66_19]|nr:MAG: hypothetical protein AUH27_02020 [Chloroflexi bacterium 13_1_40CM_66_19]